MNERLSRKDTIFVGTMLFGLFFGAGNLIFPVYMGQLAGRNIWQATAGFLITGVGLPLLGIIAQGISKSNGLLELSSKVSKGYGFFFTCLLYLTIGPFFAIPRCATVSFTVGVEPLLGTHSSLVLALFSLLFFGIVLAFSLRPGKILTWVGKVLTPAFLLFLGILVITALVSPIGSVSEIPPQPLYESDSFFTGFLEGYNTMDALAGLAFGIVVINVIRDLGIKKPEAVAKNTVRAGIAGCLLMALIYLATAVIGTQSRGLYEVCANGGEALTLIASHYFGKAGAVILAATVTLACLKTAVGLITSCGEAFVEMFPGGPGYRFWAVTFSIASFLIANLGLNAVISYSLPVLMFLYPLAITLILLGLFGGLFSHDRRVYFWVTVFTLIAACFDFLKALTGALPQQTVDFLHLDGIVQIADRMLPFFDKGFGWVVPALLGLIIGLALRYTRLKM